MSIRKLEKQLKLQVVKFKSKKESGEERIAIGTQNLSLIPNGPTEFIERYPDKQLTYWDMEKQGWRSLSVDTQVEEL